MKESSLIVPDWPAPPSVRSFATTRRGGVSIGRFSNLNLGVRTGDEYSKVSENRERLGKIAKLPSEPVWLKQVHGCHVIEAGGSMDEPIEADGAVSGCVDTVCAVLTADCLPILLCNRDGTRVGVAHAGWRGLVSGIIEAAVSQLDVEPGQIMAWLGPCIGQTAFEVGPEVVAALLDFEPGCEVAIAAGRGDRRHVDLQEVARHRLEKLGVCEISASDECTYSDPERFYSYRRDGVCGRMATLIWLTQNY